MDIQELRLKISQAKKEVERARENVEFWKKDVAGKSGFSPFGGDREDRYFAENKLSDAEDRLSRAETVLGQLQSLLPD